MHVMAMINGSLEAVNPPQYPDHATAGLYVCCAQGAHTDHHLHLWKWMKPESVPDVGDIERRIRREIPKGDGCCP